MVSDGIKRVERDSEIVWEYDTSSTVPDTCETGTDNSSHRSSGAVVSSDVTVYDCYDQEGNHWVEYEYPTEISPESVPEAPSIRKPKKRNPSKKLYSKKDRHQAILSPPGGWFFFKG